MYRFEKELELITNPEIKLFTRKCLEKAPEYFWKIPSSSTGKHHPVDENIEGGEVLHVRRVVKIADDLCRNFDIVGNDRDCVISAATMHDECKSGYPNNTGFTVAGHGPLWVNVMEQVVKSNDVLKSKVIQTIARIISCHMGRWDIPYIANTEDKLAMIVQIADYVASREYVTVKVE